MPDDLYFGAYATMKKMADFYNGYYKRFNYDTFNKLNKYCERENINYTDAIRNLIKTLDK